jgi:hypothetical protein
MAWWRIPDIPSGKYHVILSYGSGESAVQKRTGSVTVKVGRELYPLDIFGTANWGRLGLDYVKDVQIDDSTRTIEVRTESREPGVGTVLDLWRVDIVSTDGVLPEAGKAIAKTTPHGTYVQYIPYTAREPIRILVSVHGTIPQEADLVKVFTDNPPGAVQDYVFTAHTEGVILVRPAFDTPNFGGYAGPGGGYRALWGRYIGADEFVNEILAQYEERFPRYDGRMYLHGHSAGGQFANRYIVRHPDRIIGAVVSSAGSFASPTLERPWGAGMGPLKRSIFWSGYDKPKEVEIVPNPDGWFKAAQLPIAVIVGELENSNRDKPSPTPRDGDHVERARAWAEEMRELARAHGKRSGVSLFIVPKTGHSSWRLSTYGIQVHLWRVED